MIFTNAFRTFPRGIYNVPVNSRFVENLERENRRQLTIKTVTEHSGIFRVVLLVAFATDNMATPCTSRSTKE